MYTSFRRRRHGSHRGGHVVVLGIIAGVVLVLLLSLSLTYSQTSPPPLSTLSSFQRPELYHGGGKTDHYFEGWYHKLVRTTITTSDTDSDLNNTTTNNNSLSMAVVPGIFYGYTTSSISSSSSNDVNETTTTTTMIKKNESHAFIFVTINGEEQHYYRFNLDTEFKYVKFSDNNGNDDEYVDVDADADDDDDDDDDDDNYYIQIGNNRFSKYGMYLDLIPRRHNNVNGDDSGDDDSDITIMEQDNIDNDNDNDNHNDNDNATITLKGRIKYKNLSIWPIKSKYNLGGMGPVGFLLKPFLECYHDVLSFDHTIVGKLIINETQIEEFYDTNDTNDTDLDLDSDSDSETSCNNNNNEERGNKQCDIANDNNVRKTSSIVSRGYVEKDRGRSFPSLWIWIQTNSFPNHIGTSLFFSVARIPILTSIAKWFGGVLGEFEFPGFTAAILLINNNNHHDNDDNDNRTTETKGLIPFATWTGAYFEKLIVDDERVIIELNSGSIRKGLVSILWDHYYHYHDPSSSSIIILIGRYIRAWFGSWFITYDTRKLYYRLELIVNRKNVPHIMLYAPTTTIMKGTSSSTSNATTTTTTISSKMKPFVNEALNAKVHMRLYEYYYDDNNNNGVDDGDNNGEDLKRSRSDGSRSRERVRLLIDDIGEHAGLEVHQNVQYLVDNLCGKSTANRFVCL